VFFSFDKTNVEKHALGGLLKFTNRQMVLMNR